jgi:hypothetical protein
METPSSQQATDIVNGFRINWISLKDFESSRVLWRSSETWNLNEVMVAEVPKEIL